MKIDVTGKPIKSAVAAILLRNGDKVSSRPFFKFWVRDDQSYLRAFESKNKLEGDHSHFIFLPSGKKVFLIGMGERKKFSSRKSVIAARRVITAARKEKFKEIEVNLADFEDSGRKLDPEELAELLATQFEMANFEFVNYKTAPEDGWNFVEKVHIFLDSKSKRLQAVRLGSLRAAVARGKIIGEEINKARVLSNMPGGDMTPAVLSRAAASAGRGTGVRVKIFGEKQIKKLKMGGVMGVSRGSAERPRFIIMEYFNGRRGEKPVVLVGKGVTFDTGGLNLKPEQSIYEMHMDMSGGASVIHAIAALARLKIKKNLIGLIPAVENMPSGSSYHPGDLLKTMSGKTIEVLNTDAEGRIILSDALTYAQKFYQPELVIDIATLTSGAVSALGQRASAIFSTQPQLEERLRDAGEKSGDYVWPLPLWEEFEDDIKGTFGDVANSGRTRYGGAIVGAVFLWQFIKDTSWIHIDIAPRMTAIEGEYLAKGAAGASIALLTKFLRD